VQKTAERLDLGSYETQLLLTMGVFHSLAEKHGRELVPLFLSLAEPEGGNPLPRRKLSGWLELFAKFSNPKALYSADRLLALHTSLLSHADKALQSTALSCLMTYRPPHVHPHEDTLRALLDDTRWRDALAKLDLSALPAQDRSEIVPVIVRLLYGVMLARQGRGRGADRRSAILGLFGQCTSMELKLLADLMLKSFSDPIDSEQGSWTPSPIPSNVTAKQQTGFLHLLEDVLHNLGPSLVAEWSRLLAATLDIGADAQRRLQQGTLVEVEVADDEVAEATEDEDDDSESNSQSQKITRSLRQLSLKRVADFFESSAPFDFSRFIPGIFDHLISPRLSVLDRENTQAPSALLELFRVWSIDMDYVRYLVDHNPSVLPRVFDCLNATNVKPAVISRIFDIVESIIGLSEIKASIVEDVLAPIMGSLLSNLVALAQRSTGEAALTPQLTQRQLEILSRIAKYARDEVQATTLLSLLLPLLSKTHKVVNDGTKTNILAVVYELLPLISGLRDSASSIYVQTYRALCQLFQSLRARQGRITLLAAFQRLSEINPASAHISSMLAGLNAYSKKRLDEPDFDQRLTTFADLNVELHSTLSPDGWLPLLYNMLYFIQDPNELAVRSSASTSLRRFVDRVAVEGGDYEVVFTRTLYPALKNGLRTKHEMVRAEILLVLAHAIKQCDKITSLQQMRGLLADGDEEANFFNNILHVQIHRRARALRRLADYSDQGHLRSSTITDIFAPLVANFITTTGDVDHHVITEAIASLGRLAKHLAWGGYYALVQQYMRASREKTEKEKEGSERVYVRTLVTILDSFHFPMGDQADEHGVNETEEPTAPIVSRVTQKVADAVTGRLLPSLLQHLENRHGAEENMRLPIAVGIIQIALHLPDPARQTQILRLVTVVCQVLRSKSQDTRDLVRDTLRRITALLGSSYLPLVLKELRAALLRGPQLHVLAFTVHNILAFATSSEQGSEPKDLDACVNDAVHVSAEVVFGESGKDVQSEDFKTNMKEVRGAPSKGLDTFAILAQHIHPTYISGLLQPLRSILQETSSHRTLNTVDDVLRRIAGGLNSNVYLQPEDLLPLCHTLISQNARFLQEAPTQRAKGKSGRVANVTVQLKRKVEEGSKQYASNAYRSVLLMCCRQT
jgi:U3 small nucleolar RNA-associated protein 20